MRVSYFITALGLTAMGAWMLPGPPGSSCGIYVLGSVVVLVVDELIKAIQEKKA